MKLEKTHELTLTGDETILCASLVNADEWLMLKSTGAVVRHKASDGTGESLFSAKPHPQMNYKDAEFDLSAPCSIYSMDPVVVVVNDFKRHGILSYPGKYHSIHLIREDYLASISRYPIAFFKDGTGTPHLIYSEAWNHLQIMHLDTRQVLTAAKSLITENAEEDHIAFYQRHPEDNKLPWPRPYDYFFGQLLMSPDNKKFLSKGWHWGSSDAYNIYDVADFMTNTRITYKNIGYWEHSNRPACWIDDATVAVAYYPLEDEERDQSLGNSTKLHFYDVSADEPSIIKRLTFDGFDGSFDELYYSGSLNVLVGLHKEKGLIICDMEGQILLKEGSFNPSAFYPELNMFITVDDKSVYVHQLK